MADYSQSDYLQSDDMLRGITGRGPRSAGVASQASSPPKVCGACGQTIRAQENPQHAQPMAPSGQPGMSVPEPATMPAPQAFTPPEPANIAVTSQVTPPAQAVNWESAYPTGGFEDVAAFMSPSTMAAMTPADPPSSPSPVAQTPQAPAQIQQAASQIPEPPVQITQATPVVPAGDDDPNAPTPLPGFESPLPGIEQTREPSELASDRPAPNSPPPSQASRPIPQRDPFAGTGAPMTRSNEDAFDFSSFQAPEQRQQNQQVQSIDQPSQDMAQAGDGLSLALMTLLQKMTQTMVTLQQGVEQLNDRLDHGDGDGI